MELLVVWPNFLQRFDTTPTYKLTSIQNGIIFLVLASQILLIVKILNFKPLEEKHVFSIGLYD
jgi:hypothetical protein